MNIRNTIALLLLSSATAALGNEAPWRQADADLRLTLRKGAFSPRETIRGDLNRGVPSEYNQYTSYGDFVAPIGNPSKPRAGWFTLPMHALTGQNYTATVFTTDGREIPSHLYPGREGEPDQLAFNHTGEQVELYLKKGHSQPRAFHPASGVVCEIRSLAVDRYLGKIKTLDDFEKVWQSIDAKPLETVPVANGSQYFFYRNVISGLNLRRVTGSIVVDEDGEYYFSTILGSGRGWLKIDGKHLSTFDKAKGDDQFNTKPFLIHEDGRTMSVENYRPERGGKVRLSKGHHSFDFLQVFEEDAEAYDAFNRRHPLTHPEGKVTDMLITWLPAGEEHALKDRRGRMDYAIPFHRYTCFQGYDLRQLEAKKDPKANTSFSVQLVGSLGLFDKHFQRHDIPLYGFMATPSAGEKVRYRWRFSDGVTLMGKDVHRLFPRLGKTAVTLDIISGDRVISSLRRDLHIRADYGNLSIWPTVFDAVYEAEVARDPYDSMDAESLIALFRFAKLAKRDNWLASISPKILARRSEFLKDHIAFIPELTRELMAPSTKRYDDARDLANDALQLPQLDSAIRSSLLALEADILVSVYGDAEEAKPILSTMPVQNLAGRWQALSVRAHRSDTEAPERFDHPFDYLLDVKNKHQIPQGEIKQLNLTATQRSIFLSRVPHDYAAPHNLATGKPVTGSLPSNLERQAEFAPANAVDGRFRNLYKGHHTKEALGWFSVDLQEPQHIRAMRLTTLDAKHMSKFTVEGSTDGKDWTLLAEKKNAEDGGLPSNRSVWEATVDAPDIRHVRIRAGKDTRIFGFRELEIYDRPPPYFPGHPVSLPGSLDQEGIDGHSAGFYFSKRVTLHPELQNQDLLLHLGDADPFAYVYVNGTPVGGGGRFLTDTATEISDVRVKIPASLLKAEDNEIVLSISRPPHKLHRWNPRIDTEFLGLSLAELDLPTVTVARLLDSQVESALIEGDLAAAQRQYPATKPPRDADREVLLAFKRQLSNKSLRMKALYKECARLIKGSRNLEALNHGRRGEHIITPEDYLAHVDDALEEIAFIDVRQTLLPQYCLIKIDLLMARQEHTRALQILRGLAKGNLSERFRSEALHKEVLCLTVLERLDEAKRVYQKLKDEHPYAEATLRVKDDLKAAMLRDRRPVILPPGGDYIGDQRIEMSTRKRGVRIYYSTDGSQPFPGKGKRYALPFALHPGDEEIVVTAIAYQQGRQVSVPVSHRYRIKPDPLAALKRQPDIAWLDLPHRFSCAIYEERLNRKVEIPLGSRPAAFVPNGKTLTRQDFVLSAPARNIDRRGHAHWGTREPFTVINEVDIPEGAKRFGAQVIFVAGFYRFPSVVFDIVAVEPPGEIDKRTGKPRVIEHKLLQWSGHSTHFSEYINVALPPKAVRMQIRFCDSGPPQAQNLALKDVGFFR